MSRRTRTTCLPIAALAITLSPLAMAWTPYGYGPGYQGAYPGAAPPEAPTGAGSSEPGLPAADDPSRGYGGPPGFRYGPELPQSPFGEPPPGTALPAPAYPNYGPLNGPPRGFPDSGGRGFGRRSGFQISRAASDDAYTLTIELNGMGPEEVQVRTQGQSLVISRERNEQQVQKDSFDDGQGFMRSFSYSSGTARRRLSVPRDGDLSAMSREEGEGSIHIRIPRRIR